MGGLTCNTVRLQTKTPRCSSGRLLCLNSRAPIGRYAIGMVFHCEKSSAATCSSICSSVSGCDSVRPNLLFSLIASATARLMSRERLSRKLFSSGVMAIPRACSHRLTIADEVCGPSTHCRQREAEGLQQPSDDSYILSFLIAESLFEGIDKGGEITTHNLA